MWKGWPYVFFSGKKRGQFGRSELPHVPLRRLTDGSDLLRRIQQLACQSMGVFSRL